jgi:hypothetical protein
VFHTLPADEMEVHVEDGLPAMDAGVIYDAVAAGINPLAFGQHPRHGEDMPDSHLVCRLKFVDRDDVLVRHDQDMRRRDRVQVAEGGHQLIAVEDCGRRGSNHNFAEGAIRVESIHKRCQSCELMDGEGFHEWDST